MSEKRINEELSAVEAALASLKPVPSGADRDRIMFLAGRMSAVTNAPLHQKQKIPWLWPCATAISLLLAIASSSMLFLRGTAMNEKEAAYAKSNTIQTAENIPQPLWYEHTRKETSEMKRPRPSPRRDNSMTDYLTLNRLITEKGVGALPGPLWIPMGQEKYPRHSLVIQDEWKMF